MTLFVKIFYRFSYDGAVVTYKAKMCKKQKSVEKENPHFSTLSHTLLWISHVLISYCFHVTIAISHYQFHWYVPSFHSILLIISFSLCCYHQLDWFSLVSILWCLSLWTLSPIQLLSYIPMVIVDSSPVCPLLSLRSILLRFASVLCWHRHITGSLTSIYKRRGPTLRVAITRP